MIQVETAMGAAIEVFEDSQLIEVGRDRFVPVKTTNDLLVLRSDVYDLGKDFVLDQLADALPFVDLDGDVYKLVGEFDKRFPEGAPSMRKATSLTRRGRLDVRPRRAGGRRRRARGDVGPARRSRRGAVRERPATRRHHEVVREVVREVGRAQEWLTATSPASTTTCSGSSPPSSRCRTSRSR